MNPRGTVRGGRGKTEREGKQRERGSLAEVKVKQKRNANPSRETPGKRGERTRGEQGRELPLGKRERGTPGGENKGGKRAGEREGEKPSRALEPEKHRARNRARRNFLLTKASLLRRPRRSWLCRGSVVALSWLCRVSIVALSWLCRGSVVALSWLCRGSVVSLSWLYRGSIVALSRLCRGSVLKLNAES